MRGATKRCVQYLTELDEEIGPCASGGEMYERVQRLVEKYSNVHNYEQSHIEALQNVYVCAWAFAKSNKTVLAVDSDLWSDLGRTDPSSLMSSDLKSPYTSFLIEVPEATDVGSVEEFHEDTKSNLLLVLNQELVLEHNENGDRKKGRMLHFYVMGKKTSWPLLEGGHTWTEDEDIGSWFALKSDSTDVEIRWLKRVVNAIVYSTTYVPKTYVPAQRSRRRALKDSGAGSYLKISYCELPGKEGVRGVPDEQGEPTYRIEKRFKVRAHWRRLRSGGLTWVREHWKGPDGAEIIRREYGVKRSSGLGA